MGVLGLQPQPLWQQGLSQGSAAAALLGRGAVKWGGNVSRQDLTAEGPTACLFLEALWLWEVTEHPLSARLSQPHSGFLAAEHGAAWALSGVT